jgi:crossover junction endodeoxyribonuclease RusA
MTVLTIELPRALLISANDRMHWTVKANRTTILRTRGRLLAQRLRSLATPVTLTVTVTYPPLSRRRDAANLAPTVKGLLDGIVDAGLLPDDNDRVIIATTYQASAEKGEPGVWRFELEFTEAKP